MEGANYFDTKHGYMSYGGGAFSEFILSAVSRFAQRQFDDVDTAYELGAGMGRFSYALVSKFPKVFLVEPSHTYAEFLRRTFPQANTKIVEATSADFFGSIHKPTGKGACFCFHLLHHLSAEQRRNIYESVKRLKMEAVFVDPNPMNPLIVMQVLFHPAMKWKEERGYLKLTKESLLHELREAGLSRIRHSYVCFLPPFLANLGSKLNCSRLLLRLEALSNVLPFLAAYHMVYVTPESPPGETPT